MNIYFVLEGERTELKLYPKWISFLIPSLKQVDYFYEVEQEDYFVFSGMGIPSIRDHVMNAIKDINENGKFNYLIVCMDAEELEIEERKQWLIQYLKEKKIYLTSNCKLEIVVQNKCIETWLLGNRKLYKNNPQGPLFRKYSSFYNVSENDPEYLPLHSDCNTIGQFHELYLREMLKEYRLRYSKSRPQTVLERSYFDAIRSRAEETNHIRSFSRFIDLCEKIHIEMLAMR